jgi:hypothetical protein
VKNGSKMRARVSASMPLPLSRTQRCARGPGTEAGCGPRRRRSIPSPIWSAAGAALHGVPGVDAQIDQHLVDLRAVGFHPRRLVGEAGFDAHHRGQHRPKHADRLLDERTQRLHDEGLRLPPAEGEDLLHQASPAYRGSVNLREADLQGMVSGATVPPSKGNDPTLQARSCQGRAQRDPGARSDMAQVDVMMT